MQEQDKTDKFSTKNRGKYIFSCARAPQKNRHTHNGKDSD
jgi:hypothetical protein